MLKALILGLALTQPVQTQAGQMLEPVKIEVPENLEGRKRPRKH